MPSTKLVIGGAAAGAAIGVRVARSLHGRWRLLPAGDRERLASFAHDAKEKALDLRGSSDREAAEADLNAANQTLAAALVETAEADPDIASEDVDQLREELRRELERLAAGDKRPASRARSHDFRVIKASRSGRERAKPPQ